ncbi:MAG: ribosome biogenesis GTPase Der, partial [Candidatus Cybelea sp.]
LNALLRDAVLTHPPAVSSGKPLRIYYASQPATHPPLFLFHCNDPDLVQTHYKRFLENTLRSHFDFEGIPLKLEFRARRERAEIPA